MISFDLKCDGGHIFEVWFRSSTDFENQRSGRQISCPFCGDDIISKAVMAPAVSAKGNRGSSSPTDQPMATAPDEETRQRFVAMMKAVAETQAEALKKSQWVGADFAERARAMHYGEADHASIHGTATARDARAMMEEGLAVAPLIVPVIPPDQAN